MIILTENGDIKNKACRCNPNIILRDWISLSLKIKTNPGIACSNRFIDLHYKRIFEKFVHKFFIIFDFCAVQGTIQEFPHDNNR